MLKRIINLVLFSIFIYSFVLQIYQHKQSYTKPFSPIYYQQLYLKSQYLPNEGNQPIMIEDHDLYAYAGWYYLNKGIINTINPEHPPLGKYFIGLSILIFNNQNVGQMFWLLTALLLVYKLIVTATKNRTLGLIAILLIWQEGLFQEQLFISLLDIQVLAFLLLFIYIQNALHKQSLFKNVLLGLCLGAISSIKFPLLGLIFFLSLTGFYILNKEKKYISNLLVISSLAAGIYLLSYLPFFIKNNHPSFLELQINNLKLYLSHIPEYPKFQVFKVLFFDQWLTWWQDKAYVSTGYWNLFWPIAVINFFISAIFNFKKNLLINLWSLFYLLFISLKLFFPRYLLLLLPFLYFNLCYNAKSLVVNFFNKIK